MTRYAELSFVEPTVDASAVALGDLAFHKIHRRLDWESNTTLVATLAATGVGGGATVTTTVTAPGEVGVAHFYVTSVDSSGNEGNATGTVVVRWLPPARRRLEIIRGRPG